MCQLLIHNRSTLPAQPIDDCRYERSGVNEKQASSAILFYNYCRKKFPEEDMVAVYRADVIVVGAGTAGCLFAWRMAQRGHKVIVLEALRFSELGKAIEIFHMEQVRFQEFNIPHPQPPELIHTEEVSYTYSPDLKVRVPIHGAFYVMNMPAFIRRLQEYARRAGVRMVDKARVTQPIVEDGRLTGLKVDFDGVEGEARANLIVDASGLTGAVRTRLPDDFGVENQPVPADRCLYVCLELRTDIPAGFPTGSNGYMFHKAFWNKSYGDDVVLGIGQPRSFENAWQLHGAWRQEYFGDPGKVVGRRQGAIPFTRTPFSLVGNGVMLIGDSANQNKPFSGEGVTSGFAAVMCAVEAADQALRAGDTSRAGLWAYNVAYHRGQGAKFAASLAQLPAAAELSRRAVNYLFRQGIIFSSADFEELNRNYEIVFDRKKMLRVGAALAWGVLTGQFELHSLKKFLAASTLAGRIKAHYLRFPAEPAGFDAWAARAKELWGE